MDSMSISHFRKKKHLDILDEYAKKPLGNKETDYGCLI